jgi:hypothetical protein
MFWPIFKTLVFDCLLGVIMVLGTIWQFGASQVIPQQKNIVLVFLMAKRKLYCVANGH